MCRLALKAFTYQKRQFFPHLEDEAFGKLSDWEIGLAKKSRISYGLMAEHKDELMEERKLFVLIDNLKLVAPDIRIFTYQCLDWLKRASTLNDVVIVTDQAAVIELHSPSVFRVVVSLHPVGSMNPDAMTFPSVKNILLLDSEGKRVTVKYYADDWPTHAAKLAFEKSVFTKTQKINARTEDLHFFVTGGDNENELILATVLQGFFDAVGLILRNNVDKRTALENLDLILLCLDEIVDEGIILETEANAIAGKTSSDGMDGLSSLSEQVHEVLMLLNQLIPSATQVNRNDELVLPKEKLIEDHPDFDNFIFSLFT
ncbi:hypothetical protein HPP92_019993 [Vanilla planifolia]|uniref:Coatomer subunit zeta n=1 Tax=Vanilla planifolia TaxID=51239 RepID=A0A835Q1K8_VANPL|nr:hypothetical protein HPP92_019993 [Vanilla planifolia]